MHDIIIIGAGPAGLFTALNIQKSRKVLILEKMASSGKKLLMSGSGRCNITQAGDIEDFFEHYGECRHFLRPALKEFTNDDLINFLNKRKIQTVVDKNGKVFPASQSSADVLKALLSECKKNNVEIELNSQVKFVKKIKDYFLIKTETGEYFAKNLVIATGGKSYPTTGSTGDGYYFAAGLGHTIIKPRPALTPVKIKKYKFADCSGNSLKNIKITLFRNSRKLKEHTGDLLFTHTGLSGAGILDFSRYLEENDLLRINLIGVNSEEFNTMFIKSVETEGNITIKRFIKKFELPENLIINILNQMNLDSSEKIGRINKLQRKKISELFCEYPFEVEKLGANNIAMVTKGGVSLKEVDSKTMQSKLVDNLFFAGEILDIDGDTGGYNLQAAFSTGYLAAKKINSL